MGLYGVLEQANQFMNQDTMNPTASNCTGAQMETVAL